MKNKCTVIWSRCKSIFENLALEEWIFRRHDFEKGGEVLLLWSNRPAAVIGRHQNQYVEVNVPLALEQGIDVARRHSGGGAVFHGLGNLNLSLMTTHANHNRAANLRWITHALNVTFGTRLIPTKRDDIVFSDERKVSGTAARIARNRAYHHLTLLVDEDLSMLRQVLRSPLAPRIETNATQSVRAKGVGCLGQAVPGIGVGEVQQLLIQAFISQFKELEYDEVESISEVTHPGIGEALAELRSFEWLQGKSPRFTLDKDLVVTKGIVTASASRPEIVGAPFSHELALPGPDSSAEATA